MGVVASTTSITTETPPKQKKDEGAFSYSDVDSQAYSEARMVQQQSGSVIVEPRQPKPPSNRMTFNPPLVAGAAVLGLGVVLYFVAMATPAWTVRVLESGRKNVITSMGPWRTCGPVAVHTSLHYLDGLDLQALLKANESEDDRNTKLQVYSDRDVCGSSVGGTFKGDMQIVQAMTFIGVAFGALAAGLATIMLLIRQYKDNYIGGFTCVLSFLSFVFIITGVSLWAANIHQDCRDRSDDFNIAAKLKAMINTNQEQQHSDCTIGYSFNLSIIGGLFILMGGLTSGVSLMHLPQGRQPSGRETRETKELQDVDVGGGQQQQPGASKMAPRPHPSPLVAHHSPPVYTSDHGQAGRPSLQHPEPRHVSMQRSSLHPDHHGPRRASSLHHV